MFPTRRWPSYTNPGRSAISWTVPGLAGPAIPAAAAAALPRPVRVAALRRAARVAAARRLTSPGSAAGAGAAVAGCPGPPGGTDPVAAAVSPGAPGPAAGLRSPVAPAVTAPGSGSGGIAAAAVRAVRGIFP